MRSSLISSSKIQSAMHHHTHTNTQSWHNNVIMEVASGEEISDFESRCIDFSVDYTTLTHTIALNENRSIERAARIITCHNNTITHFPIRLHSLNTHMRYSRCPLTSPEPMLCCCFTSLHTHTCIHESLMKPKCETLAGVVVVVVVAVNGHRTQIWFIRRLRPDNHIIRWVSHVVC